MKHHLFQAKDEALKNYNQFVEYLDKELSILENVGYTDSERFLRQFPKRAKTIILGEDDSRGNYFSLGDFSREMKDESLVSRVLYLSRVVDYLEEKSKESKYAPAQGSFWESIGQTLEKLASEVQEKL